jgi:P2-related tail formation protein
MTGHELLPTSATQLEKDLADLFDNSLTIQNAINTLPTAKYGNTIPNSYYPYLIWEYNLGELSEWVIDPLELLKTGLEFRRVQGTPKSLDLALSWIGFSAKEVREGVGDKWYLFEIDTGGIPTYSLVTNIVKLANLAKPIRSRLFRLYHGLDLKPFTFNDPEAGFNLGIFSNTSGFYDEANDVWLSYEFRGTAAAELSTLQIYDVIINITLPVEYVFIDQYTLLNIPPEDYLIGGVGQFAANSLVFTALGIDWGEFITDDILISAIISPSGVSNIY